MDSAGVAVGGVVECYWLLVAGGLSAGLEGAGSCEVVDDWLDWVGGCVLEGWFVLGVAEGVGE